MLRPRLRAILLDLSGTLHIGRTPTPKAVEALERLRDAKIPVRFCTNTSKESSADLHQRLADMGFSVRSHDEVPELWTSLSAVKRLLQSRGYKRPYLLVSEAAQAEFIGCFSETGNDSHDAVVIGLAPSMFDYEHLNRAFQILIGEDNGQDASAAPEKAEARVPLIATHKAKYFASSQGRLSLGPGPIVTALESASGSTAEVVGKPSRRFFEEVVGSLDKELNGPPDKVSNRCIAIVGDDIEADLGEGAVELGFWRVLVKTGKYRPGDETRVGAASPDEVCDSFADFVDKLLGDT